MFDRPEPVAAVDHVIPIHGANDPLFWDPDNWQSLCLQCHGLKSWRESQQWIVDWAPIESRIVVTGAPATGKTWYCSNRLEGFDVWDMDAVADELGYRDYPRPEYQRLQLVELRRAFVADMRRCGGDERRAVIVTSPAVAFDVVKMVRGRLVHTWAPDHVIHARLAARADRCRIRTNR